MTTDSPARVAVAVTGRLAALNAAGFLDGADCLVARRIARLVGEGDDDAVLALAFAVRAAREGSSALHLDGIARLAPWLPGR